MEIANVGDKFKIKFLPQPQKGDLIHGAPEISIINDNYLNDYKIECHDCSTDNIFLGGFNDTGIFYGPFQYFALWNINIYNKSNSLVFNEKLCLKDKLIYVEISSSALGDTIAWFPYVDEFRTKHDCKLICSTSFNWLFEDNYPDIIFIPFGTKELNVYAHYIIGVAWDGNPIVHPVPFKEIPLQKVASDILGLEYTELKPIVSIPNKNRNFKFNYVCISEFAGDEIKHWKTKNGWQRIVDFLNDNGIKVLVISREPTTLKNVIDKTGNIELQDRLVDLKFARFFIGLSSGLSWLSWSIGTHSVLISDYTPDYHEFKTNITRIHNLIRPPKHVEDLNAIKSPVAVDMVIKKISELISSMTW